VTMSLTCRGLDVPQASLHMQLHRRSSADRFGKWTDNEKKVNTASQAVNDTKNLHSAPECCSSIMQSQCTQSCSRLAEFQAKLQCGSARVVNDMVLCYIHGWSILLVEARVRLGACRAVVSSTLSCPGT
jgi:hypothetical protein